MEKTIKRYGNEMTGTVEDLIPYLLEEIVIECKLFNAKCGIDLLEDTYFIIKEIMRNCELNETIKITGSETSGYMYETIEREMGV